MMVLFILENERSPVKDSIKILITNAAAYMNLWWPSHFGYKLSLINYIVVIHENNLFAFLLGGLI